MLTEIPCFTAHNAIQRLSTGPQVFPSIHGFISVGAPFTFLFASSHPSQSGATANVLSKGPTGPAKAAWPGASWSGNRPPMRRRTSLTAHGSGGSTATRGAGQADRQALRAGRTGTSNARLVPNSRVCIETIPQDDLYRHVRRSTQNRRHRLSRSGPVSLPEQNDRTWMNMDQTVRPCPAYGEIIRLKVGNIS